MISKKKKGNQNTKRTDNLISSALFIESPRQRKKLKAINEQHLITFCVAGKFFKSIF